MNPAPAPIIRPSARDFEPQLFGRCLSPDAISGILNGGTLGDLAPQHDLFNLMEDTWPRLRANLQKIKSAARKLPLNVQPWTDKNGKPSATAQEKAAFIESALHLHGGISDTSHNPLQTAVYELMDAVARGISAVEIDWQTRADGFLVPVGFRRVPIRYLAIADDGTLALNLPPEPRGGFAHLRGRPVFQPFSPSDVQPFGNFPGKFLVGIFRSKSGPLGEAAQLRALAPLWLGHMLGWEWLVQKTELFGTPFRWATYPSTATQADIDVITGALRNMGTAAWGAFPQGTNLQFLQGAVPGVSGPNDPTERLLAIADRACDLLLLGQNLTSEINDQGSRAAAEVHREVELDLYETYAEFIIAVLNDQLIPALIRFNWGDAIEVPFVDVDLARTDRDEQMAARDKLLFQDMGLPVSLQFLYERHKVPCPGQGEALFHPAARAPSPFPVAASASKPIPPPTVGQLAELASAHGAEAPSPRSVSVVGAQTCCAQCSAAITAASESAAALTARQSAALAAFPAQLAEAEGAGDYLVWNAVMDSATTPECQAKHGHRFGDGWTSPPPAHFNCRSTLTRVPKATYQPPPTV